ncbi:Z1 domain-containing protein [Siphonobacter sp. SORGH_AS_1065]|uniref:Z1 domain-containing protein n=1 Tax=Siphonobacter sp. SORGH_AS_1065 TaxID=3041795 RepID=UPI00278AE408|nr:Z1 domain-containing protein [Siphonobacter sp. SORGH_AS_1065]MDQ1088618.1 hypothetical protein [Siphonobacter sp. SORGH_AS_1065]
MENEFISPDFQKWEPLSHEVEVLGLLNAKNKNGNLMADSNTPTLVGEQIITETFNILSLCGQPSQTKFSETGLVIGYVQSGKTLSFTALTAMARDNEYQLIIVIAGISKNLIQQTTDRLKADLKIPSDERKWILIENPKNEDDFDRINSGLKQWNDHKFPRKDCQTVLVTVMKNASHLKNLGSILQRLDLTSTATIIIDDEGDQASLNTNSATAAREGVEIIGAQPSTIYKCITDIRSLLPHHTFLQYTATPQAPLFINILDRLSPNFIKMLTPGSDYTGGKTYFVDNPELIEIIPASDIVSDENELTSIPESLLKALRIFFIGVADGFSRHLDRGNNRTMMIHPSRTTGEQREYTNWVNDTINSWIRILDDNGTSDQEEFLQDFGRIHREMSNIVNDLTPFDDLVSGNFIDRAIRYTARIEVNASSGKTPNIHWSDRYSFILIGGQALDRGFTVEGLTVTYMPRNLGTGNVDTILQRARFFGYKRSYLKYCRLFLPEDVVNAYRQIVVHEEDVRSRLTEHNINDKHLDRWGRESVLSLMLNLTRRNVLYNDVIRQIFRSGKWFDIKWPHDTDTLISHNYQTLIRFLREREQDFVIDDGDSRRTQDQKNLIMRIPVKEVLELLLNHLKFTNASDSAKYTIIRSLLTNQSEIQDNLNCNLYLMSTTSINDWNPSIRSFDVKRGIRELFQGRNEATGYPGAREIAKPDDINIQIHLLNLRSRSINYDNVPTLAIQLPSSMQVDLVQQPTNHI